MIKIVVSVFLLLALTFSTATSQTFPGLLQGTWKLENKDSYERWDLVNSNTLKGFVYELTDGKMVVTEYLEISKKGNDIIYTATVLNQNQGIGIDFILKTSDGLFSFENPGHDFPKFIRYQFISNNKMKVTVGTDENNFILHFQKTE
jgi:major membrane immunogen (membrane-anchored lipoprotein)